jgi:hypothetical protein
MHRAQAPDGYARRAPQPERSQVRDVLVKRRPGFRQRPKRYSASCKHEKPEPGKSGRPAHSVTLPGRHRDHRSLTQHRNASSMPAVPAAVRRAQPMQNRGNATFSGSRRTPRAAHGQCGRGTPPAGTAREVGSGNRFHALRRHRSSGRDAPLSRVATPAEALPGFHLASPPRTA